MGRSGNRYDLEAIGEPGDEAAVRRAVFRAIFREWADALDRHPALLDEARGWLDDVITVEIDSKEGVAQSFTVLLYDSVEWAIDRGHHWLRLAFACGRLNFDHYLSEVGYALVDDDAPMGTVLAALESKCDCAYCQFLRSEFSLSLPARLSTATIETLLVFATNNSNRWAATGDVYVTWTADPLSGPVVHTTRDFAHFRRAFFPGVKEATVHEIVAGPKGIVALLDVGWFSTADGRAWTALDGPAATRVVRDGDNLWAWGDALHRSIDGSLWRPFPKPSGALVDIGAGFALTESELFTRDGDDWRPAARFDFRAQKLLVTKTPGTILVTGTGDKAAMLVRSTDGGKTWATLREGNNTDSFRSAFVHPDGRLFWTPYQIGTLEVSSDDGATWTKLFADYQPQQLLADPARPDAILAASFNRLVRIT